MINYFSKSLKIKIFFILLYYIISVILLFMFKIDILFLIYNPMYMVNEVVNNIIENTCEDVQLVQSNVADTIKGISYHYINMRHLLSADKITQWTLAFIIFYSIIPFLIIIKLTLYRTTNSLEAKLLLSNINTIITLVPFSFIYTLALNQYYFNTMLLREYHYGRIEYVLFVDNTAYLDSFFILLYLNLFILILSTIKIHLRNINYILLIYVFFFYKSMIHLDEIQIFGSIMLLFIGEIIFLYNKKYDYEVQEYIKKRNL